MLPEHVQRAGATHASNLAPMSEAQQPPARVSVLMPVWNTGRFLDEAIASVRSQTAWDDGQLDFEILAIDDASNDPATQQALSRLERQADARIRVLRLPRRSGVAAARNLGLANAAGRWVAFLDSDDIWLPRHIELHIRGLQATDAVLSGSDYRLMDEDGRIFSEGYMRSTPAKARSILAAAFEQNDRLSVDSPLELFIDCCPAWTGTTVVDAAAARRAGLFDETLPICEDVHYWIRMAAQGRFVFNANVTALYRKNLASLMNKQFRGEDNRWLAEAYRRLLELPEFATHRFRIEKAIARNCFNYSYTLRGRGRFTLSAMYAVRAVRWGERRGAVKELIAASVRKRPKSASSPLPAIDSFNGSAMGSPR